MKFRCQRKEMTEALRLISRAVATKSDTPVLSGIYIETKDNKIMLQATDNKIGFICHIDAQTDEPGRTVITAKYFQEFVNKMPGDVITFEYDTNTKTAKITSDNSHFTLLSINYEDFPVITPLTEGTTFTLNSNMFFNLIRKTSFACSNDENRPLFTGCNLSINNGELTMVATNTHRLSVKKTNINTEENVNITIPAKILNDLTQTASTADPFEITVTCTESKIGFSFADNYMSAGIIKGEFPDYRRAVPKTFATHVHLSSNEFREAIERVALISRTNEYNIIKMHFGENEVVISSQNPEIGKAEEKVSISKTGEDLDIAFNAQYMIDILKIIDAQEIDIDMNNKISPISITEPGDESFLYISTPVRTTD